MSDSQAAWMILWRQASGGAFEADDVVPELADALGKAEGEARRVIANLLGELSRLPDGRQFFEARGGAVVPLRSFDASPKDDATALASYPFEL